MNNNSTTISSQTSKDTVDLSKILSKIIDKWQWVLLSIIICCVAAFLYIRFTSPTYLINARVLVNDEEKGGGAGLAKKAGALMDLGGLLGASSSVDNEAEVLKTRFIMEQVVRKMQLNIIYKKKLGLIKKEVYASPIKLNIIKGIDTIKPSQITIAKIANGKLNVKSKDRSIDVKWNEIFQLKDIGTIQIVQNYGNGTLDIPYVIEVNSIDDRVKELMEELAVTIANKQVTIIDLSIRYPLPNKGEDILNELINQYITANLRDKNIIADSTTKFIQNRLSKIAGELGDVENKVEKFKQSNQLADMTEQGKVLVQNTGEFAIELAKAETQVTILNDLEKYLKDESKNKRVFPTSLMPQDLVFSGLLNQYNSLLVERDKLLLSVTETSPFVQNIDVQVLQLRKGILENIQNTKNSFVVTRNKLRKQLNQAEGQIGGVPQIEKDYLQLARNQKIKQELYIFLMQKAEETAISKTSNRAIAKTIDPPKAEVKPVSPKKIVVFIAGLLIGIIVPMGIILTKELLNTTVKNKTDISNNTNLPIIGEISHNDTDDNLIVSNKGRSAISEQFRALRTNLSFYLKNDDQKIILVTSSMSGEGKSFTAINLGNVLALSGKKVLLMELDLRKPGLTAKLGVSNSVGFSNYTIDRNIKVADIIQPLSMNNMWLITSGPLPPNPAETLMSEHMPQLITKLKEQFDYIIMDAPPIGIIADAQLLSDYADATIYLVRQKVTEIEQVKIANDLYVSNKMKNMGIVVNDINSKDYGYGYGYGHYGHDEIKTGWFKNWLKRIS